MENELSQLDFLTLTNFSFGNAPLFYEDIPGMPRYLVIDFSKAEDDTTASDEDIRSISKKLIEKNRETYEVLKK